MPPSFSKDNKNATDDRERDSNGNDNCFGGLWL